jgi:hypothetical protein
MMSSVRLVQLCAEMRSKKTGEHRLHVVAFAERSARNNGKLKWRWKHEAAKAFALELLDRKKYVRATVA